MCESNEATKKQVKWLYLLRQLLVATGTWSSFFILGLNVGTPTVLVPQLRAEANSTDAVTPEQASWFPATISYSGIPWVFLLPMIAYYFGRKITYVIVCISTLIGYTIFYTSSDIHQILISAVFQGAVMASYSTIAIIIVTEYTSSEYRGVFLTIKSATFFWGILTANCLGTFVHWKYIPLLGFVCTCYSLFTVFFWPESPLWLVKKGRFDQTAKSHRWLKGTSEKPEKELYKLISENQNYKKKSFKFLISDAMKTMVDKVFYKPVILSMTLLALHAFSGKLVCVVYAIDMLKKITNSTKTAYTGMLILDAVTVFTMYIGCGLAKSFKRRSLLFISSSIAILFLISLSLYLYLVKLSVVSENKYISILLLVGYSISIACGPMILSTSISGELIPTESRSLSLCVIGLTFKIINGTFLKLAPYAFKTLGMHGTFLFFGLSSGIILIILYKYLPETKDKTLHEIDEILRGKKPIEEAKELLPPGEKKIKIVSKDEDNL